jgi:hypothetical protein
MKAQIFLVISLGATGFDPKTCSTVSARPAKLIAYPPNATFFDLDLLLGFDLAFDFDFGLAFVFLAVDFDFLFAAKVLEILHQY